MSDEMKDLRFRLKRILVEIGPDHAAQMVGDVIEHILDNLKANAADQKTISAWEMLSVKIGHGE